MNRVLCLTNVTREILTWQETETLAFSGSFVVKHKVIKHKDGRSTDSRLIVSAGGLDYACDSSESNFRALSRWARDNNDDS